MVLKPSGLLYITLVEGGEAEDESFLLPVYYDWIGALLGLKVVTITLLMFFFFTFWGGYNVLAFDVEWA